MNEERHDTACEVSLFLSEKKIRQKIVGTKLTFMVNYRK